MIDLRKNDLHGRIRDNWALSLLTAIYAFYGSCLCGPPTQPLERFAALIVPLRCWAGVWLLAAGVCAWSVLAGKDLIGLRVVIGMAAVWAFVAGAGWAAGQVPFGWLAASLWLITVGLTWVDLRRREMRR